MLLWGMALVFLILFLFYFLFPKKTKAKIRYNVQRLEQGVAETGVNIILEHLKKYLLNKELQGIATIQTLEIENKKVYMTMTLEGIPDRIFSCICNEIHIAKDGSWIKLNNFTASPTFLFNLLNDFASRTFAVPQDKELRKDITRVRTVLDLK